MKNQERHKSVVTPGKDLSLFVSKMAKIGQRTKQTFANISEKNGLMVFFLVPKGGEGLTET